jgi:DNA-binding phage protein
VKGGHMNIYESYCGSISKAVSLIFKRQGVQKKTIAAEMGMLPQNLNDKLMRTANPKWDFVLQLLDRLDYRMVLVPKDSYIPLESIEIKQD